MNKYAKRIKIIVHGINEHPLAKRHKLRAYFNFLRWQIRCIVNNKEKKTRFTDKTFLVIKKGMAGATGNIYLGLHEFNDMGFLLHFLNNEDLFIDIGANIGSYAILAAGHVGANVIAIEPIPSTFLSLQKNIQVNNLQNKITALEAGVGVEEGILRFTLNLDTVNHVASQFKEEMIANTIEVRMVTIDGILKDKKKPSMIKIDVEGFETEVLNGMQNTLQDQELKAIIIELNGSGGRYGYDENLIHQKFLSLGFNAYRYDPFKRSITQIDNFGKHNTIYIRDLNFVTKRISVSEEIKMFSERF
ncbi:MAG: FkbM family methyltransferase [Ginsengibacter sp.]